MHTDNVYQAFTTIAQRCADQALLIVPPWPERHYYKDGIEFSYKEVLNQVELLRERYHLAGYGHGHRVALLLENRPEYFIHFLALNSLGASVVPINPDYRHDEVFYLLEHSDAELIVAVSNRVDDMKQVAASAALRPAVIDAETIPERMPPPKTAASKDAPTRATEAALLYTSGTTGRPKGCMLSNDYHFVLGESYLKFGGLATIRPNRERLYNPLPLFHMNASILSFMCMLLSGGCLIVPDRFHPRTWWQELVDTQATIVHYLGVIAPLLLNQPPTAMEKQHQVRFGIGAGIEPQLHGIFEERFGFPLLEIWGMTETGAGFIVSEEPRRIDTRAFGRPGRDYEARVVNDFDEDVPTGQEGELLVRRIGPDPRRGFFSGYLKDEQATQDAWRNCWFHTGDVVRQDADGMLYFVDRKKNIIRRSGENIAAAEVEAVLQAHGKVAQVAVLPLADELREEEVMACIVPHAETSAGSELAQELFDWCMQQLAYFKAPGWIVFIEEMPTTGTQKVQKGKIFAAGEDPRRHPGAIDMRHLKKRDTRA